MGEFENNCNGHESTLRMWLWLICCALAASPAMLYDSHKHWSSQCCFNGGHSGEHWAVITHAQWPCHLQHTHTQRYTYTHEIRNHNTTHFYCMVGNIFRVDILFCYAGKEAFENDYIKLKQFREVVLFFCWWYGLEVEWWCQMVKHGSFI